MSENQIKDFALFVKGFSDNIIAQIEFEKLCARVKREKYLALVANGFTETQALELCKR